MNEAERIGLEIGARIKALKADAVRGREAAKTATDKPAPPTVTVNVPEAPAPIVNVEPVVQVEAVMPDYPAPAPMPAPVVNVAPPDLGPITEILGMMAQMLVANTAAVNELTKASMAEKRIIIEDGVPVGVRPVH